MPIKYSDDFVKRVKDEYPKRGDVIRAVEKGEYGLGKLLQEGSVHQMAPEEIVRCFHEGEEDLILKDAQAVIRRRILHADWMRMMVQKIESMETEPPRSHRNALTRLRRRLLPDKSNGGNSDSAMLVAPALAQKA
jgi:hypothetical protein